MFNKSHALTYAYITYICAWLKANYPAEFFTALMSVRSMTLQPEKWAEKAPDYIREAKHFNIDIRFPDINKSDAGFIIASDQTIHFGFSAIKKVGAGASNYICKARELGKFKNIQDFLARVDKQKVNTGVFQNLVLAGAFDTLGYRRIDLLENTETMYAYFKVGREREQRILENAMREVANVEIQERIDRRNEIRTRAKKKGYTLTEEESTFLEQNKRLALNKPLALPDEPAFPEIPRFKKLGLTIHDILSQGELLGCYINHPASIVFPDDTRISAISDTGIYHIAGIVSEIKTYKNSNGSTSYVTIGDGTGSARLPIYDSSGIKVPSKGQLVYVKVRGGYLEGDEEQSGQLKIYRVLSLAVHNFGEQE